jgi:hypothetical protein
MSSIKVYIQDEAGELKYLGTTESCDISFGSTIPKADVSHKMGSHSITWTVDLPEETVQAFFNQFQQRKNSSLVKRLASRAIIRSVFAS